jgi:hypothetical protein
MGYISPELFDENIFKNNKEFTKFGTPVINQADPFAIGMILASFQLDKKSFVSLNDLYIKISEKLFSNCSNKDDEKKFIEILEQGFKKSQQNFVGKDFETNKMLNNIIRKLLVFDPFERYPVQIAMYVLYQIYLFSKSIEGMSKDFKKVVTDEELIGILKIILNEEIKDANIEKVANTGKWNLNSEPYQEALKDIEGLLRVKKGESELIEGCRII